jgi:ribose-phosphate pyrophosphokinase
MEMLMMLDIAKSASAREIHAIIPYFSYARSDKKDAPRISITARLVGDLLVTAGATHIMTMQLHSAQVHGFFGVPADPLTARGLFAEHLKSKNYTAEDTVVVAPDVGGAKSSARLAGMLDLPVAAANKTRASDKRVEIGGLIGRQVAGFRRALVHDDEIATGGTVIKVCEILIDHGIEEIILIVTHGLFLGNALERLSGMPQLRGIVTTDTVPLNNERQLENMTILSTAPVFAGAIYQNYYRLSIGKLFDFGLDGGEET